MILKSNEFNSEDIFKDIIKSLANGRQGKMFGAACLKSTKNKVAVILWKDQMLFKLDEIYQNKALKLAGSKQATHLYDSSRPMKNWIAIPAKHFEKWAFFSKKALTFVEK